MILQNHQSHIAFIAIPKQMKYTPPQPSPCQGEGARQRGWGDFVSHQNGKRHIQRRILFI